MSPGDINARLDLLRGHWDEGSAPALFEAVHWCQACRLPLPEWAALAVLNVIIDRFNDRNDGVRTDYRHYVRWLAVANQLRRHNVSALPSKPGRPRTDSGGVTATAILTEAQRVLQQESGRARASSVSVSLEELRRSYEKVKRSRQAGESRFRFEDLWSFENA